MSVYGVMKSTNGGMTVSKLSTVYQLNQPVSSGTWADAGTNNWPQLLTCAKVPGSGAFIGATAVWQGGTDPISNNSIYMASSLQDTNPLIYNQTFDTQSTGIRDV